MNYLDRRNRPKTKPISEQPTQGQIKEFWEWCGFKFSHIAPVHNFFFGETGEKVAFYIYPSGDCDILPDIDLNNLFKYAVPKPVDVHFKSHTSYPEHTIREINCWLYIKGKMYEGWAHDPALALFWALWQVKEASK